MAKTKEKEIIKDVLGNVVNEGDQVVILVKEYGYRKLSDAYLSKCIYCGKGQYGHEFVSTIASYLKYKSGKTVYPYRLKDPQMVKVVGGKAQCNI